MTLAQLNSTNIHLVNYCSITTLALSCACPVWLLTGMVAVGRPLTGMVAVGRPLTGMVAIGRPLTGMVAVGRPLTGMVAVGGRCSSGVIHASSELFKLS